MGEVLTGKQLVVLQDVVGAQVNLEACLRPHLKQKLIVKYATDRCRRKERNLIIMKLYQGKCCEHGVERHYFTARKRHTHTRTHARTHSHTHAHARTHARTHTLTHACTRTHARTHTHTHTNTHTHTPYHQRLWAEEKAAYTHLARGGLSVCVPGGL